MFCSEKGALDWNKLAEEIVNNRDKLNDRINNVDYFSDFKVLYYDIFLSKLPSNAEIEKSIDKLQICAKKQSLDLKGTIQRFVAYIQRIYINNEFSELKKILNQKGIYPKDLEAERKKAEEEARRKREEQERKRRAEEEMRRKREQQEQERKRQEEEKNKKKEEYNNITEVRNWSIQARNIINSRHTVDVKPIFQDFLKLYQGMATNLSCSDATTYIKKLKSHRSKINDLDTKNSFLGFVSWSTVAYKPENNAAFKRILKAQNLMPNPKEQFKEEPKPQPKPQQPRPTPKPQPEPKPEPVKHYDEPKGKFDKKVFKIFTWFHTGKGKNWAASSFVFILVLWVIYVIFSFFTTGFLSAIWLAIKSGLVCFGIFIAFVFLEEYLKFIFYRVWSLTLTIIIILTLALAPFISTLILNTNQTTQNRVENVISTTTYRSISKSGLNVRAIASSKAQVIGSLKYNQEVEVIKEVNGFAEIKYGDGVGYVSTKYIEKKQNTGTSKKVETKKEPKITTTKNEKTTQTNELVSIPKATNSSTKQETKTQTNSSTPTADNASTASKSTTPTAQTSTQTQNTANKTAEEYYKEGVALAKKFKESEATTSLKQAINMGSIDAMHYLGMMYVNDGSAKDGFILVLQAANAGHKEAIFQVAELYSAGTGTIKDKAQAKIWYQKAEALGDNRATSRLRKL